MVGEMKSNIKVTLANKRLAQPHNAYNIYFMLERYTLIHEMEGLGRTAAAQHHQQISYDLGGYDLLTLPDLPPRFQNLQLPVGWFVPGKNSKRKHTKTHGLTSFSELARSVAANWKSAAKETKDYCVEVARIIKERHTELTKVGGKGCLSATDSVSPGPTEEAKPTNADNETKDMELCLPTMDSVSPGPKNDTKRRRVQLPRRGPHAFGDQPSQQYLSIHAPMGIFPVAHDQDTMNSHDSSRTWLMDMYHQYHHSQASATPNATTIWDNDSLNHTNINMLQPMPFDVIQDIQLMAGSAGSQAGKDHQDDRQKFRAIMNASRRAAISSMMTLPGSAPTREGIRCFGEQPYPNNRWYSAPQCQSFKESHTELTTPMTEGIRCLGEQPSPKNRRYSAPECQNSSELDRSNSIYKIEELDAADSNILGMWQSSKVQETDEFWDLFSSRLTCGFHALYGDES